jgi:hypothetical protein
MSGITAADLDGTPLPATEGGGTEIGLTPEWKHRVRVVLG